MTEYCEVEGKIKFPNQQEAYNHGRHVKNRSGGNIRVYKCSFCHFYHMTAQRDRYGKKRRLHKKGK